VGILSGIALVNGRVISLHTNEEAGTGSRSRYDNKVLASV
jgi:hypothetical protein